MIKVIWAADRKGPLSDQQFYSWWHNTHGLKEFGLTSVRQYIQHHTIPESRDGFGGIAPTRDGASMGWYDDFAQYQQSFAETRRETWGELQFDPAMDVVIAQEREVLPGETTPDMVKFIVTVRRDPSLSVEEFQRAWFEEHGPRRANLPGMRRYVQNHAIPEAYEEPSRITHDGWSEEWFDSLEDLRRALESPEAQQARDHSLGLFERPLSVVIARENPIVREGKLVATPRT